jgi:hypothetical protein
MNSIFIHTYANHTGEESKDESSWLSPFHARIAAVYLQRETGEAAAFLPSQAEGLATPGTECKFAATEAQMLAEFWQKLEQINKAQKETLVTFNGRKHTIPFLYIRSSINGVAVGNRDLMAERYKLSEHLDLLEAFTFHGIVTRPALLDLARCYNLPQPVTLEGGPMQKLLGAALSAPNKPLWEILAKSGLQHASLTLSLAQRWSKTLRIF